MAQQLQEDLSRQLKMPSRQVWERFGITDRTLDRWVANSELGFPRPVLINGRRYFDEGQIVAWERAQAAKSAKSKVA